MRDAWRLVGGVEGSGGELEELEEDCARPGSGGDAGGVLVFGL